MGKMRFLVAIFAVAILAFGAYVATGEKGLPEGTPASRDVTPGVPPEPSQMLAFGDELGFFNAEAQTGDNQCVGVGWDGTYIWVTGAGYYLGGVNYLYRFGLDGVFQVMFPQLTTSSWGWRDMCFEEDAGNPGPIKGYLWASESSVIDEIDPNTGAKTGRTIPSPMNPARAEAWQPPDAAGVEGYIWCASFSGSIYRVNIATGAFDGPYSGLGITKYGAAWNDCPGAVPAIWWTNQNDNLLREYDPLTQTLTGTVITRSWAYASGGVSYGQYITFAGDPTLGVLLNLWQGSPQDLVYAYELCVAQIFNDDMSVKSIDVPSATVTADFAPKVTVKNFGVNTQSGVPVRVTIDDKGGSEVYNEVMNTGTLAQDDEEELTFPDFTIDACEQYDIEACTELGGDEMPGNDCKARHTTVLDFLDDLEGPVCFVGAGVWEHGVPTSGPMGAHSGSNVWATVLGGNYTANACDTLKGSFIILGDEPLLMYYHWMDVENSWDGYSVQMSVNGGPIDYIEPVGGYTQLTTVGCVDQAFSGSSGWTLVTFDLTGLVATGDVVEIRLVLGTDSSVHYAGVYLDDFSANCMELAPPNVDLDVDDDYANLVGNAMTLVGVKSKKNVISYTYGDFVVLNSDKDLNVDYWDGPGSADFDVISYDVPDDLFCYHHPDKEEIPAGNISFAAPKSTLKNGEAMVVVLGVQIPDKVKDIKHGDEHHVYRGTVTVTGTSGGVCGSASDMDDFTLNVKVTKGKPGTMLPNTFVGDWGEKALTLSWGNFSFGQSYNLYREDESGEFIKLNSAPMSGNSNYTDEDVIEGGTYQYKFGVILGSGEEMVFGPMTAALTRRPAYASLMPSQPNPVNTETVIRYALANDAEVSLKIYDVSGSLVKTLVNEPTVAGYHSVVWDATDEASEKVANGVYFYRLTAGDFTKSHKLVVLK